MHFKNRCEHATVLLMGRMAEQPYPYPGMLIFYNRLQGGAGSGASLERTSLRHISLLTGKIQEKMRLFPTNSNAESSMTLFLLVFCGNPVNP